MTHSLQTSKQDFLMMESLCELYLPFLEFNRWERDANQSDIPGILSSMYKKNQSFSSITITRASSWPKQIHIGLTSLGTRQGVIACISLIIGHNGDNSFLSVRIVVAVLHNLTASHPKHVEECNLEKALLILNHECEMQVHYPHGRCVYLTAIVRFYSFSWRFKHIYPEG